MNTTASVEGCSSCGALFERAPQDRGLCEDCRQLLVSEVPSDSGPRAEVGHRAKATVTRIGGRRRWKRVAIAAAAALMLAGGGAWWMNKPARTGSETFSALRRYSVSETWSGVRRRGVVAWTGLQRHASDAWVAIRRHIPFGKQEATAAPPARTATREATASRGTHKRSK